MVVLGVTKGRVLLKCYNKRHGVPCSCDCVVTSNSETEQEEREPPFLFKVETFFFLNLEQNFIMDRKFLKNEPRDQNIRALESIVGFHFFFGEKLLLFSQLTPLPYLSSKD